MLIRSRAPVRIDFAGGWTDVALFTGGTEGIVVNAAINVYSYGTISYKPVDNQIIEPNRVLDKSIRIYSTDFDTFIEAEDIRKLEYDGNIDLVKAAIRKMSIETGGFDLITQSTAPPGSGLGTSASMGVALIGVLSTLKKVPLLPYEHAELASDIERNELGILGGKQDHYASAIGGINFMEFSGEEVKTSPIHLPHQIRYELEKNLILGYTGQSRLSGDIHQKVTFAYHNREKSTLDALHNLRSTADKIKNALMSGRLSNFGQLLSQNWESQKALHPSVTNDRIDGLFQMAIENGAGGGKACGAGGGGCILFYCNPNQDHLVRKVLEENGVTIIDFNFDFSGLKTWRVNE
ncbi:TPA: GHMP kinase [Candidatus Poribacteria bacterium]|nr:GHMP kinase [Candidatus Poribacteria bacterium]